MHENGLDNLLTKVYSGIGKFYQDFTGKTKNDLAAKLYIASAAGFEGVAINYWPDVISSIPTGIAGLAAGALAYFTIKKMQLTEKTPIVRDRLVDSFFSVWYGGGGISLTILGATQIIYSNITNDYSKLENGINRLGAGLSSLTLFSAYYLTKIDIEPPSGKTIPQKIKQYISSLLQKPVLNPNNPLSVPA